MSSPTPFAPSSLYFPVTADICHKPLDMLSLYSARLCHDVIGPVGAILNGCELLEMEEDPATQNLALDLIKKSAAAAARRLKFYRLIFIAASPAGLTGALFQEGQEIIKGLAEEKNIALSWTEEASGQAHKYAALYLVLCFVVIFALPQNNRLHVEKGEEAGFDLVLEGEAIHKATYLSGALSQALDPAHSALGLCAHLFAKDKNIRIDLKEVKPKETGGEKCLVLKMRPDL